jgi:hypothetical protein
MPGLHGSESIEPLSATQLEHLRELSGALADLALAFAGRTTSMRADAAHGAGRSLSYADGMSDLIRSIAKSQPNLQLTEHILDLTDRLLPARVCEPRLFSGAFEEAAALWSLWDSRRIEDLRLCLREHHGERVSRAGHLASLVAEQASQQP